MKKDRWFDWTEYALLLGSGAGAVASVATQQALLAAAPLSLLAALGLINRRQLQNQLTENQSAMVSLNSQLEQRLQDVHGQLEDLPNHDQLRAIRQSIVAQNKQDILSLSQIIEYIRKKLTSQIDEKQSPNLQDLNQQLIKLQEHYTGLSVDLKDVKSRCQQLSDMSRIEATETMVSQLETDLMQLRVHLEALGANAKNNYAGFNDKLTYFKQQVQQLSTEDRQSLLKGEIQELVKTVSEMVSRDEFSELSTQLQEGTADKLILQELQIQMQQRLDDIDLQMSTMTNSILEAVAETLEPLQESVANSTSQWLLDFSPSSQETSNSRQALEQLMGETHERLVLVWPWTDNVELDDDLIQQFRQVLRRNCRLDIGWCHQGDNREQPFLRNISQRWNQHSFRHQHLKHALNQLLPLKQAYPDLFSFKILGTTENFAVSDSTCALVGIQALPTKTSLFPMVKVKLRTLDPAVVEPLIQRFENPAIAANDAKAYFNRGITRYDIRDYIGAIEDFTQVLTIHPSAAAYNCRGVALVDREDYAAALHDFGHALQLDPCLFAAHCNRGVLRMAVRDFRGAIDDLAVATHLRPQSAIPYFYLGQAYQLLKDLRQAVGQFSLAIERQPDLALPYCYRAAVYQKQGSLRQAVTDLETAAQLLRTTGDLNNLKQVMRKLELLKVGTAAIA